ncbi:MAG: hypothetical protein Q7N50_02790 [Armatimonadota bacterium]|nr:hypothetical protein [Armatimonadota bacterium]
MQDEAALDPIADERRREAHLALAETTAICARVCADCGRCCFEEVDRFTPFDQIVRRNTDIPAPSGNLRIYSLPWMVWNAIAHGFQRLFRLNRHRTPPPCRYLSSEGCSLPREDRPMICVSWFCPRSALAMDRAAMDAAESPLCVIESLHREALRSTKRK